MELKSDVELSELDKCRFSHNVDSVGVFVELTIFNACSAVSGWNLLSSGAGVAGLIDLKCNLKVVLVSASACGIHGMGLVAVVLGLVISFLVMLMSWSGCSFLMCCAPFSLRE